MATGRETRAAIDTETVKGLLLINGGGAVALLAFLSSIIDKPHLDELAKAVMVSAFVFQLGLVTAVIHNRLRRLCSYQYSLKETSRKKCSLFGRELNRPCICHWSTWMLWLSIGSFIAAGSIVLAVGLHVVNRHPAPVASPEAGTSSQIPLSAT